MNIDLNLVAFVLAFAGLLAVAFTALKAHYYFLSPPSRDEASRQRLSHEQQAGIAGVIMLATAFILHLIVFLTSRF